MHPRDQIGRQPFLKLIRQPTLLVMGDDDPIIPAVNARIMARLIPDARLHLYSGGHIALHVTSGNWKALLACFLYFDTGFTTWVMFGPLAPFISKQLTLSPTQAAS